MDTWLLKDLKLGLRRAKEQNCWIRYVWVDYEHTKSDKYFNFLETLEDLLNATSTTPPWIEGSIGVAEDWTELSIANNCLLKVVNLERHVQIVMNLLECWLSQDHHQYLKWMGQQDQ